MSIDKYLDEDGEYLIGDTSYSDAVGYFMTGVFGFCRCGRPEKTLLYIRDAMRHVANLQDKVWEKQLSFEDWDKQADELFKAAGPQYLMWYLLDSKELTEHGGSVPGWLTDKGREVLADLEEMDLAEDE